MRIPSVVLTSLALALAACGSDDTPAEPQPAASSATADIVATAEGAGQFGTLLTAVRAADLEATLKGPGPFTVFAPTDDAFAKLPAGTVEGLLRPENKDELRAILTYHVVGGRVASADAVKLSSAKTVNGQELTLKAQDGALLVDEAKVVQADIEASNGIIHVIDTVMLPE